VMHYTCARKRNKGGHRFIFSPRNQWETLKWRPLNEIILYIDLRQRLSNFVIPRPPKVIHEFSWPPPPPISAGQWKVHFCTLMQALSGCTVTIGTQITLKPLYTYREDGIHKD
jgi:hypothetical protein